MQKIVALLLTTLILLSMFAISSEIKVAESESAQPDSEWTIVENGYYNGSTNQNGDSLTISVTMNASFSVTLSNGQILGTGSESDQYSETATPLGFPITSQIGVSYAVTGTGTTNGLATLDLKIDSITVNGVSLPISTSLLPVANNVLTVQLQNGYTQRFPIQYASINGAYTLTVSSAGSQTSEQSQGAPSISYVTSITANNVQTICIYGSGFGTTQPQTQTLDDGSVDTVRNANTPSICISNCGGGSHSWAAGIIDTGCHALIGVFITQWSDSEIILGGFGTALGTNDQATWNIGIGDPLDIAVYTPNGEAHFRTNVVSTSSEPDILTISSGIGGSIWYSSQTEDSVVPSGTSRTIGVPQDSILSVAAIANPGYSFSQWATAGGMEVTQDNPYLPFTSASGSTTVGNSGEVQAQFQSINGLFHSITFTETGLPMQGISPVWKVTLFPLSPPSSEGSTTRTSQSVLYGYSSTNTIVFNNILGGDYKFTIDPVNIPHGAVMTSVPMEGTGGTISSRISMIQLNSYYEPTPASGMIRVSGEDQPQSVTFVFDPSKSVTEDDIKFISNQYVTEQNVQALLDLVEGVLGFFAGGSDPVHCVSNCLLQSITVGNSPLSVAFDSANGDIYASNSASGNVTVISGQGRGSIFIPVGVFPTGIAYDPVSTDVFVANSISGTVSVINGTTNSVVDTVYLGGCPWGIAIDSAGRNLYATDPVSNSLEIISLVNRQVTGTIKGLSCPMGIVYDETRNCVYVSEFRRDELSVIDCKTNSIISNVTVGHMPISVAYDYQNGNIYVANYGNNTVSVVNEQNNNLLATIPVDLGPVGLACNGVDADVYVCNFGSGTISVINGRVNSVVATIPSAYSPWGVTWDSLTNHIWVADFGSNMVREFQIKPSERVLPIVSSLRLGSSNGNFVGSNLTLSLDSIVVAQTNLSYRFSIDNGQSWTEWSQTNTYQWMTKSSDAGLHNLLGEVQDGTNEPVQSPTLPLWLVYNFSAGDFLTRVNKTLRTGTEVPIDFQLIDSAGNLISTAKAQIWLVDSSNQTSKGAWKERSNADNYFSYDSANHCYSFNLDTRNINPGQYEIIITSDDGAAHSFFANFSAGGSTDEYLYFLIASIITIIIAVITVIVLRKKKALRRNNSEVR